MTTVIGILSLCLTEISTQDANPMSNKKRLWLPHGEIVVFREVTFYIGRTDSVFTELRTNQQTG
jgi:hypothetical protein